MNSFKKLIVVSVITVFLVGILVCLLLLDLPIIASSSISSILGKNNEIIQKEANLLTEQASYKSLINDLEETKTNYEKEKSKYEAISEETINIIKESNYIVSTAAQY